MSGPKRSPSARLSGFFLDRVLLRRFAWHARRISGAIDGGLMLRIAATVVIIVLALSLLVTVLEKPLTFDSLLVSINWAVHAVFGKGEAGYLTTPGGFLISWIIVLIGAAMLATITAGFVAVVIDYLLKEGQGMGVAGFRNHVVVCGWNGTARELIEELRSDDYKLRVVLVHDSDRNPAGDGVYFVKGDATSSADLARAAISEASAALVFPADESNAADMRSILTVMAIETVAPHVRTVAEVNDPRHVEHFRRAHVDEVLVTSRLASRLLARSALYPGLTELVTDIVSGGAGSELYRVTLPPDYLGLTIDTISQRLRAEHRATLLAVSRGRKTIVNPPTDFRLEAEDDALVVAESLGSLAPLRLNPRSVIAYDREARAAPSPSSDTIVAATSLATKPGPIRRLFRRRLRAPFRRH
jgi:voltage-gated potassium channel